MKRYLLSLVAAFAFIGVGTASAGTPGPADIAAIGNNLGPTVEALADGLGNTLNTLISTQSAVQTSAALGNTVVNTASTAIAGAPNLAALSLGITIENIALQQLLNPALTAIDDPTAANIQNVLSADDLNTIVNNLQPALVAATNGDYIDPTFQPYGDAGKAFVIHLLEGDIFTGAVNTGAAFYGLNTLGQPVIALLAGTPYGTGSSLAINFGIVAVMVAGTPVLEQIQPIASQLADAGAPLTDPVVGALKQSF